MFRVAQEILNLPAEGVTAWGRLLLAFVAFTGLSVSVPAGGISSLHLVLLAYLGFALTLVVTRTRRPFRHTAAILIHVIDVAISSALMVMTSGVASPFFVFFLFTVLSATLRWEWMGAALTTILLTGILLSFYAAGVSGETQLGDTPASELPRTIIRGGFLLIAGAMLAYMGAYRERARERFARLADWPRGSGSATKVEALQAALAHSAQVLRVPRMLAIWDETDEPHRHVLLWNAADGVQYSAETAQVFGDLGTPNYKDRAFLLTDAPPTSITPGRRREAALDPELQATFGIRFAASAPFRRGTCRGRVFALDRPSFNEEDLSLISVIAARIGIELEERILRDQLAATTAEQERARLGRDLHDGVLQGLAAASIQLKVLSAGVSPAVQEQLKSVRNLLAEEAQRIRTFVEATRKTAPSPSGIVPVEPEVRKRIERLRELWSCQIELDIAPRDLNASLTTTRNLSHMIGEAVANAVRHGQATKVSVRVEKRERSILLSVQDNGNGFENLSGSLTGSDLAQDGVGPRSLRSRIEDLGGTLYLSSSTSGTNITVELPS